MGARKVSLPLTAIVAVKLVVKSIGDRKATATITTIFFE
jgi:hypothetical protein